MELADMPLPSSAGPVAGVSLPPALVIPPSGTNARIPCQRVACSNLQNSRLVLPVLPRVVGHGQLKKIEHGFRLKRGRVSVGEEWSACDRAPLDPSSRLQRPAYEVTSPKLLSKRPNILFS